MNTSEMNIPAQDSSANKLTTGLLWFCRIFVGVLFIISGLIKVNDISGFAYKLNDYFGVFEKNFGLPSGPFVATSIGQAAFISIFEVVIAVMLLVGFKPRITAILLLAMIIFFTFLTGYSWITNSVTDCGCFGDALKLTPKQSFFKDVILTVLIGYIFYFWRQIKPLFPKPNINLGVVLGSTLITSYFTYYCYAHLPIIDFRPACVGCNLIKNTTDIDPETGDTKLKGYFSFGASCGGKDELKGNSLLIIIKDITKLSPEQIKRTIEVHNALQGTSINVFCGTASLSDDRERITKQYNIPYCISAQDETLLKTMIRSSLGYILIKDGVVRGQWHDNDTPTKEEILAKL